MTTSLSRRQLLAAGAASGATLLFPLPAGAARRRRRPLAQSATFPSGVVAGEVEQRSVVLWTQADGLERTSRLMVEVAREPDFRRVVARQGVMATESHAFTAKARIASSRLDPGEEYFYRFATRDTSSPVGRFRTARPADSAEPLRVGFFSCQQWEAGYYAAHRALAQEDCDLLVCLGDYIYENNGDKGLPGRADSTGGPNGENETLEEYRRKYRLYRSDPHLQAAHASAAFVGTWDDHEVENNHAAENEGTTSDRRLPYEERRANAYQVWYEQMPLVRVPADPDRLYRRVPLGGMADLFLLDLRQYRDDQPCNDTVVVPCPEAERPERDHLGAQQERWLKQELERSGAAWKILGSSVEMMAWDGAPGQPLNPDGWDGYRAERRRLLEHVRRHDIRDVTVLTGDIHVFHAGTVSPSGRSDEPAVATEFVGGSITSGGVPGTEDLGDENMLTNPHFAYANYGRRGYGVIDLRPDEARVRFRSPTTVRDPNAPVETIAEFRVPRGRARVERV